MQSRRKLAISGLILGLAGLGTLGVQKGLASSGPMMVASEVRKEPFLQSAGEAPEKLGMEP
jgi:hypothetical protein